MLLHEWDDNDDDDDGEAVSCFVYSSSLDFGRKEHKRENGSGEREQNKLLLNRL